MNELDETLTGRVSTICFMKNQKEKNPYKDRSKSKEKKKDFSNERNRKRNWE